MPDALKKVVFLWMDSSSKGKWIDPVTGFQMTRRRLPHMQNKGAMYFTASNTAHRIELSPEERDIVFSSIKFLDGKKYELEAAVVMPDHFHLLMTPLPKADGIFSLSEIFHSIKSFSAHAIKRGTVFQDENYDHLIRNELDYNEKFDYLIHNPIVGGLAENLKTYRWLYYKGADPR
jgi:REP element-mobilizing transposase RayT